MSFKEILPSKQLAIRVGVLIGILVIVIGIRQINKYKQNRPTENAISAFIGSNTTPKTISNDFLKAFWPEEFTEIENNEYSTFRPSTINQNTTTSAFIEDIIPIITTAEYLGATTPELEESLINILNKHLDSSEAQNQYDISFFKTVQTSSSSIQSYIKTMEGLLNQLSMIPDPLDTMEKAINTGSTDLLPAIQPSLAIYQSIEKKLLENPTPTAMLYYHVNFTNGIAAIRLNLERITKNTNDPVSALAGITQYKSDYQLTQKALHELMHYAMEPYKQKN